MIIMTTGGQAKIVLEGSVYSEILKTNRFVRIYLPSSYKASSSERCPVLYLHDGQNTFTTAGPHAAFGWGDWQLDATADHLAREGKMKAIIMVAIDCSRDRYREYRGPTWPGSTNTAYENYKKFLIAELKPKIDREYRTLQSPENTGVMGSSMGGICSLALAWEHPEVFGQAASVSGAFQVEQRYFLNEILKKYGGGKKPFRIYLDSGNVDFTGGDDGCKDSTAVVEELLRIGWKQGKDLEHFVDSPRSAEELKSFNLPPDKFVEAQKSQHNELYWRLRAWRALTFMFPPKIETRQ